MINVIKEDVQDSRRNPDTPHFQTLKLPSKGQIVAPGPWELVCKVQKYCERQHVWLLVPLACSAIKVAVGGETLKPSI
jgi:hypothetical protein